MKARTGSRSSFARRVRRLAVVAAVAAVVVNAERAGAQLSFGSWQNPTNMPAPRGQAAAVTDPGSGKIYIVGGYTANAAYNTVDVYDPATNSWSSAPPLPQATRGAAAAYANGKIFVFGGYRGDPLDRLQVYALATQTWTEHAFPPGAWESAAAAADGMIYVFGGEHGAKFQTVVFDPVSLTWTMGSDMPNERLGHGAAAGGDGLYVFGGFRKDSRAAIDAVDRYDPEADTWSTAPADMPTPRLHFAEGVLAGHYLAAGGTTEYGNQQPPYLNDLYAYNLATDAWTTGPPLPEGLREAVGAVSGGTFYVFGGFDSGGLSPQVWAITPEPAALVLLGVGALGLIRRRRGGGAAADESTKGAK